MGAFRDSRYDVIFAHAQITGRQCSGQYMECMLMLSLFANLSR